jgi:transposase
MRSVAKVTIGVDLGDKRNAICILDESGDVVETASVANTLSGMREFFSSYKGALVAIETGTHSPWVSRMLSELECKVLVGNSRKLRSIWKGDYKTDSRDAEMLARIARFDQKLFHPIHHRGLKTQSDLALLKARDILVQTRTSLINHIRGTVKTVGERLDGCGAEVFHKRAVGSIPEILKDALLPVIEQIEALTKRIRSYDRRIEEISKAEYKETALLRTVPGVGPITAMGFVVVLEKAERFKKSREVGSFLGLTPKKDQSGDLDKQLRITKAGDKFLRKLLVSSAQYTLGPFGPDSELRRFGLKLCQHGGKAAKKRAIVAVARKIAVLLHRIWITGEEYDPFYVKHARQQRG